jgi:hypothetical protein
MGLLCLLPLILLPSPISSSFISMLLKPHHQSISFSYRLGYSWDEQDGAKLWMATKTIYPHFGVQILYDLEPVAEPKLQGWVMIPYSIYDPPGMHEQVLSSAAAYGLDLGNITNGDYVFKVVMSAGIDTYYIHKTDQVFSADAGWVSQGELVAETDFEKRLDGFTVECVGYPIVDNRTKQFIADQIRQTGGTILGIENGSTDGWVADLHFFYSGDKSNLRHIITQLDMNDTDDWVKISSNTHWFTQTSQYWFTIALASPENANSVMNTLLEQHLIVFKQNNERFSRWENATVLKGSSASLDKTWGELRENFIQSISNKTSMVYETDFYVSY